MNCLINQPRILLHNVEGPVNLGSTARVMANMGFNDLGYTGVLTGSEKEVILFALKAFPIIESAEKYEDLESMIADCQVLIGFTPRDPWPDGKSLGYCDFAEHVRESGVRGLKIGFLFGNEAHGLNNEDLTHCNYRVALPTSDHFPSMNLSHAVLSALLPLRMNTLEYEIEKPAPSYVDMSKKKQLTDKIFDFLDAIDYLGKEPSSSTRHELEAIWKARQWTERECNLLLGVFNKANVRSRLLNKKAHSVGSN